MNWSIWSWPIFPKFKSKVTQTASLAQSKAKCRPPDSAFWIHCTKKSEPARRISSTWAFLIVSRIWMVRRRKGTTRWRKGSRNFLSKRMESDRVKDGAKELSLRTIVLRHTHCPSQSWFTASITCQTETWKSFWNWMSKHSRE